MKTKKRILAIALLIVLATCLFATPAFAISEEEVQNQVDAEGKESVSGNVLIWFLCAIAFLKISQKIDSFMSSLGINVGHTGGSMLAEAMIAVKGFSAARGIIGHSKISGSHSSRVTSEQSASFMKGGLVGVVSRSFTRGAIKNATNVSGGGFGGMAFTSSMEKGGAMANRVISTVATGSISSVGMIKGAKASQALMSYMGYAALEPEAGNIPSFSNVEIGGGRITGIETSEEHPTGSAFAMYHADQYAEPSKEYSTVTAADGSKWYKQYMQDSVEKTPYMAPDGGVAYHEKIVKKLPDPPRRKDRF